MNPESRLAQLAAACGIEAGYHDIFGEYHALSAATARRLLAAMGIAADNEAAIEDALHEQALAEHARLIPRVCVWREGDIAALDLNLDAAKAGAHLLWQLHEEGGRVSAGAVDVATLEYLDERAGYTRRRWCLPWTTRPGYHELHVQGEADAHVVTVIVAPRRCWSVPATANRGRPWGIALQLYSLRSARNWGIGDLGDLSSAVRILGALGADLVGINPLHALYPDMPEQASPYSPSSRQFANPLYLDVEAIADFADCETARARVAAADFQAELARLRATELVDYTAVAALKWPLLASLHRHFRTHHLSGDSSPRGAAFRSYQAAGGLALTSFATFEVLRSILSSGPWPPALRDPQATAVHNFAREHAVEIEFREYLQWQLEVQLKQARQDALASGMRIGLYQDLAVGSDASGADVWAAPRGYAHGVSIGAPRDDFNLQGQVWGLTPWLPQHLYATAYADFIAAVRANMRAAGALRIDHAVGLMRMFWVASGDVAGDGAFVRYPMHDLLAILALESVRQQCLIIGEDLGTVPDALRHALDDYGVLAYRVLYFCKHWDGDHGFMAPDEFPAQALVTVTTHDLATLAGYWSGHDLDVRERLALFPDAATRDRLRAERAQDRLRLLAALERENLRPDLLEKADSAPPSRALTDAVQRYTARANSNVMMVQIEDILRQLEQINVPGTVDEQPNWRRRLSLALEAWSDHAPLRELCTALNRERISRTDT